MAEKRPRRAPSAPLGNRRKTVKLEDRVALPEQYHEFEPESSLAIEAALWARRPLLVRGEPGVGKTQLAAAEAKARGWPLLRKVVDSRTEARDLMWEFDAVLRLAEAQVSRALAPAPPTANGPAHPPAMERPTARPPETHPDNPLAIERFVRPGPLWWAFDWSGARDQARRSNAPEEKPGPGSDPPERCVVLIDEIDKADTDVPNGLLEALGAGEFTPLGRHEPVQVTGRFPLVIITTNEERTLPAAFLRRCLVLHLRLPDDENDLIDLLVRRARVHFPPRDDSPGETARFEESVELFRKAAAVLVNDRREAKEAGLSPLPGQAEYLDLIRALRGMEPDPASQSVLLDKVSKFALRKNETL